MCFDEKGWFFRRDEFDLLEEAFEDLINLQDTSIDESLKLGMKKVVNEQLKTEEQAEKQLVYTVSKIRLEDSFSEQHPTTKHPQKKQSIKQIIQSEQDRDALYIESFVWAKHVLQIALTEVVHFRAQINACLVPIKVTFAHAENGDQFLADQIALGELQLAICYLGRSIESLEQISGAEDMAKKGRGLQKNLTKARERLEARIKSPRRLRRQ